MMNVQLPPTPAEGWLTAARRMAITRQSLQANIGLLQANIGLLQAKNGLPQPNNGLPQPNNGLLQPDEGLMQSDGALLQADIGLLQADFALLQAEPTRNPAELSRLHPDGDQNPPDSNRYPLAFPCIPADNPPQRSPQGPLQPETTGEPIYMPRYDQGPSVRYDSGLRYDDTGSQPAPTKGNHRMNKVRRNWSRLSLPRILADSKNVVDSNKTNADIPAPNAAHTALTAAHDDLEQEYNKLLDAEQLAKTIRDRVHAKQDTLIGAMGTFASYAEALTEGDLAKLHAAGLQVAGASGMSAAAAAVQTMNLVLTMGDNDGELDASWDPVSSACVYEIQTSTNPLDATLWKPYGVPQTRSSAAIIGLPSGQRIWVRVRAIGTSETAPGPWSDPTVRTVP